MTTCRKINEHEHNLISHLLDLANNKQLKNTIPDFVIDLNNEGMGGIELTSSKTKIFGKELISAKYIDKDNVQVLISLNLDTEGNLFELDFWKVNFDKLIEYPNPGQLVVE